MLRVPNYSNMHAIRDSWIRDAMLLDDLTSPVTILNFFISLVLNSPVSPAFSNRVCLLYPRCGQEANPQKEECEFNASGYVRIPVLCSVDNKVQ